MLYDLSKDYDVVGQTLRQAADYLEEHGHCKGTFMDPQGRVCLYGALNMVIYEVPNRWEIPFMNMSSEKTQLWEQCGVAIIESYAETEVDAFHSNIINWNDRLERKPEQVVDLLRKAADTHKVTV